MANKNKGGRPLVWTNEKIKKVVADMEEYTNETDIPIVAEFAYLNGFHRTQLYEHDGLTDALKRMITKKEAQLEKMCLFNVVNASMAIFSLKQMGWRDKQELQHTTIDKDGESTGFNFVDPPKK